jgi:hypothetical protein
MRGWLVIKSSSSERNGADCADRDRISKLMPANKVARRTLKMEFTCYPPLKFILYISGKVKAIFLEYSARDPIPN